MGRFSVAGSGALAFLQRVLTNDAAALEVGRSQYTLIPDEPEAPSTTPTCTALWRTSICWWSTPPTEKGLGTSAVAAQTLCSLFAIEDLTVAMAMVSLQGRPPGHPRRSWAEHLLPEPTRNRLGLAAFDEVRLLLARTW